MRTRTPALLRFLAALAAAVIVLVGAGCLEKRLIWSPDGTRAAVIGDDGLYLCDRDGHLTPLLLKDVRLAAWRGDARNLVVATERSVQAQDSAQRTRFEAALGDAQPACAAEAERLWTELQQGKPWGVLALDVSGHKKAVKFLLFQRHRDALKAKLSPNEWQELGATELAIGTLQLAQVDGERLTLGTTIHSHVEGYSDLRVSPGGAALAWTQPLPGGKDDFELLVSPLDAPAPTVVARHTAAFPDWQPDGRSLVYVEAAGATTSSGDDIVKLGALTRRQVLDAQGRVEVKDPDYLAGMLFNMLIHVRCLRDGRVVFNAVEMSLPLAAADYGGDQREQLYAVDLARQSTLVRLLPRRYEARVPQVLAFFEVSPDDTQVLFGGMDGEAALLTLASGEVKVLQERSKDSPKGIPTWRAPGEFTYVKRIPPKNAAAPTRSIEVMLVSGEKETVFSRAWNDEALKNITGIGK